MWYWGNHGGPKGRNPHWLEPVFWVVFLGSVTVAAALTIPTDRIGRMFLVAVTTIGWAWVLIAPVRRRRRESRRAKSVAPPQERDA